MIDIITPLTFYSIVLRKASQLVRVVFGSWWKQTSAPLALQVIDCDMCDEIRTVYSLSGGESFLISLALALGLSSLSSNNLKVESLFIDEGFGSLDADSLRTAMEALEQLQMQGRKIGVISHVQEMSERISVQVQVHKKVNGKSVLTVVG